MKLALTTAAAAALLAATSAQAADIPVTSYSGPNGGGTASGGGLNYWDLNYNGSGSTMTDGAPLSGGTGDLTDGHAETAIWSAVENSAGTGPYVGWSTASAPNPLLTFNFAGSPTIQTITIWLDNNGSSGVSGPANIWVDNVAQSFTLPTGIGPVTLSGLNLTGSQHTIQFQHSNTWLFISEISFSGITAVPEPGTWAMMIGGFGLVGAGMRRRRRSEGEARFA